MKIQLYVLLGLTFVPSIFAAQAGQEFTPPLQKMSVPAADQFLDASLLLKYRDIKGETIMRPLHHADLPIRLNSNGTAEFLKHFNDNSLSNFFNIGPRQILWCAIGAGVAVFICWLMKANPINIDLSKNKGLIKESSHKHVQNALQTVKTSNISEYDQDQQRIRDKQNRRATNANEQNTSPSSSYYNSDVSITLE